MTHRERVLAALNHTEPDRVPMDLGGTLASTVVGSAYPALRKELGLGEAKMQQGLQYASLADIDEEVRAALDVDIVHAPHAFGTKEAVKVISTDRFQDEWGVQWHKPEKGHYYVEKAPFAEEGGPEMVEGHRWPNARDLVRTEGLADAMRKIRRQTDYAISLELRGRVMSLPQFLCGFEKWMMDLAGNQEFVQALLERTTQLQIEVNEIILNEAGDLADIVYTSDDLGGQNGPLISPDTFDRLFAPHFRRIWGHIRSKTQAKLCHHCCGSIAPFIGDMIDMGVQALNPVQVSAANMEPAKLKAEFGKHMTFWGGVDTRDVMPRGTKDDVRREVGRRIQEMGRGGGFILAAVHNLQPEVPPANIVELFKAGRELGQYPLDRQR